MSESERSDKKIAELVADLRLSDGLRRQNARETLIEIGTPAVPQLVTALGSSNPLTRWEAAKSLAEIAHPSSVNALVAALADEDSDVRWVAGDGLVALGEAAVVPLLTMVTKSRHDSGGVDEGAHHVLRELARRRELQPYLRPVLDSFTLPGPETAVRVAAEKALEAYLERG